MISQIEKNLDRSIKKVKNLEKTMTRTSTSALPSSRCKPTFSQQPPKSSASSHQERTVVEMWFDENRRLRDENDLLWILLSKLQLKLKEARDQTFARQATFKRHPSRAPPHSSDDPKETLV